MRTDGGKYEGPTPENLKKAREKAIGDVQKAIQSLRDSGLNISIVDKSEEVVTLAIINESGNEQRHGFMLGDKMEEKIFSWARNPIDPEIEAKLKKIAEANRNNEEQTGA